MKDFLGNLSIAGQDPANYESKIFENLKPESDSKILSGSNEKISD